MRKATITELKNGLSALIDQVKAGESIVVTDRGVAVAVIEPVTSVVDLDERMSRLERGGVIRRGTAEPPIDLIRTPGPRVRGALADADLVAEERRDGW